MTGVDKSDHYHTTDGVLITPGLWVWNNNLDSVQIDPTQFTMQPQVLHVYPAAADRPGWDGWYNTLKDGQRDHIMNGTRMATVFEGVRAADHQNQRWTRSMKK